MAPSSTTTNNKNSHTIGSCLNDLGINSSNATIFDDCETMEEEFKVLKKLYHTLALEHHPDKGGNPETFMKVRAAFEVLKDLKLKGKMDLFSSHLQDDASCQESYEQYYQQASAPGHTPSYEYYEQAAEQEMPGYKVELAKTGRSGCEKCKPSKETLDGIKANIKGEVAALPQEAEEEEVAETALVETTTTRATRSGRAGTTKALAKKKKAKSMVELGLYEMPFYIPKDSVRVGSLNKDTGGYGRWHHVGCWRVPYRVWAGLTDPTNAAQVHLELSCMEGILLDNYTKLPAESQAILVQHVMEKSHWAKKTKASKAPPKLIPANEGNKENNKKAAASASASKAAAAASKSKSPDGDKKRSAEEVAASLVPSDGAIVVKKKTKLTFVIPSPDDENALEECYAGKRFVLTGVFPEIGGGMGLDQGKSRVKDMIESFGGRITGSVSGKTDYLVVGKSPGMSKVSKAQAKNIPLIDLHTVRGFIVGEVPVLEEAPAPQIASFSSGYRGNGLALLESGVH